LRRSPASDLPKRLAFAALSFDAARDHQLLSELNLFCLVYSASVSSPFLLSRQKLFARAAVFVLATLLLTPIFPAIIDLFLIPALFCQLAAFEPFLDPTQDSPF